MVAAKRKWRRNELKRGELRTERELNNEKKREEMMNRKKKKIEKKVNYLFIYEWDVV